jgi:glutamate dehydrogenase (NAD(P)+)
MTREVAMQTLEFPHVDEFGPATVAFVADPALGLEAVVVIDNVAIGPAIGGTRMAPDITVDEVARLARAMTLKNAAAGLPHGGAKSGIKADPAMPHEDKVRLVRAFGRAIAPLTGYIPGPDMGLDEGLMAHIRDTCGRAVGLPAVVGGIPLDVLGATGYGVAVAGDVCEELGLLHLPDARVVIQGFGAVGSHAARFLTQRGARIVAVSDSRGAVVSPTGLDVTQLLAHKRTGASVATFPGGQAVDPAALVGYDCEVWVPAARPDVFTADNAHEVKARVVLQGANIPATAEAERVLFERGVVVVPDFIANAGGVICAAVEYAGGNEAAAFEAIRTKISTNTREVLRRSQQAHVTPRAAADELAQARVREAMTYHAA